jgi:hypothetical protein
VGPALVDLREAVSVRTVAVTKGRMVAEAAASPVSPAAAVAMAAAAASRASAEVTAASVATS